MAEYLNVSIPITIGNTAGLQDIVQKAIIDNQKEFHEYLDRLIHMGDAGLTVNDDSLEIEECYVDPNSLIGHAHGTFTSDYYAGCKDMNSTDEHEVSFSFEIQKNSLVFSIELPPEWIPVDD